MKEQVTEKPDFGEIAYDYGNVNYSGSEISPYIQKVVFHSGKALMEKIWNEHVEPLKEENDKLREALKNRLTKEEIDLLYKVQAALWIEGYYDPTTEETRKLAQPLSDIMTELNKTLKFKK